MACVRTKRERIRYLAAKAGEKLVHPSLGHDRSYVTGGLMLCHQHIDEVECSVSPCTTIATFECDGCDYPICAAHATRKGTQQIVFKTGMTTPGWTDAAVEDTIDLCPFCMFPIKNPPGSLGSPDAP
jgi:hypothetical protein